MAFNIVQNIHVDGLVDSQFLDLVNWWEEVKSANSDYLTRVKRNFAYYTALQDRDVIKSKWLNELADMGLEPKNLNLIQLYVEGHAGNFNNYIYSPKYQTNNPEMDPMVQKLTEIYTQDSNLFSYNSEIQQCVLNSCIIRGVLEFTIQRSPDSPMGRIRLKNVFPSDILFDPSVRSPHIARDSKRAFKRYRISPADLIAKYPHRTDAIKSSVHRMVDKQMQPQDIWSKLDNPEDTILNQQTEVLEVYHIVPEEAHVEFDVGAGVILPKTNFKIGSEEHKLSIQQWAREKDVILSTDIKMMKTKKEVLMVTSILPTFMEVLENRKDERQIIGKDGECHLPFYSHSFMSAGGVSAGVPDQAIDAQDDINLRELTKTKFLHNTPQGKFLMHPMLWGNDADKKKDIMDNINDPTVPIEMSSAAPPNQVLAHYLQGMQIPPDVLRDEVFKISIMDQILRLPPAMRGQPGKSGESAILHDRKVGEANMMLKDPTDRLEQMQLNIFHDYKILALDTYGGRTDLEKKANLNREFMHEDKKVSINKVVGVQEDGEFEIENDFSKLDSNEIMVTADQKNKYLRQVKVEKDLALLQQIPSSPSTEGQRTMLYGDLLHNLDSFTSEQKQKLEELTALGVLSNELQLKVQITELQNALNPAPPQVPEGGLQAGLQQLQGQIPGGEQTPPPVQ